MSPQPPAPLADPARRARSARPWSWCAATVLGLALLGNVAAQTRTITTVAGTGVAGFSGDNGPATAAQLSSATDTVVDAAGNLFIADSSNHRIRRIAPDGTISTVAGTGTGGFSGDGGPATRASLNRPNAVALDTAGNLFIADTDNHRVRRMAPNGTITTVAGTGTGAFAGDGGPAIRASLNAPHGIALDGQGNLYIADTLNHRVRLVATDGTINTLAGTGIAGFSGDGALAFRASFNLPRDVLVDAAGNIFVSDSLNHRVRRFALAGNITTVAGNGTAGSTGDGLAATAASLNNNTGLALDGQGNLYIAEGFGHRVRQVNTAGIISTVAGVGTGAYGGDGGAGTNAFLNLPEGLASDAAGNLYISEFGNNTVRRLAPPAAVGPVVTAPTGGGAVTAGAGDTVQITDNGQTGTTVNLRALVSGGSTAPIVFQLPNGTSFQVIPLGGAAQLTLLPLNLPEGRTVVVAVTQGAVELTPGQSPQPLLGLPRADGTAVLTTQCSTARLRVLAQGNTNAALTSGCAQHPVLSNAGAAVAFNDADFVLPPGGGLPATGVDRHVAGPLQKQTVITSLPFTPAALSDAPAAPTGPVVRNTANYNVYLAALVPGQRVASVEPFLLFQRTLDGNWGPLSSPIAAFLSNIGIGTQDTRLLLEIVRDGFLAPLVDTEVYIGYGTSDAEMLAAGRYRGLYRIR